jgi:hypothetical protein
MVKRINDVVLRRVQKENAAEQFTVIMADVRNKVFIPESKYDFGISLNDEKWDSSGFDNSLWKTQEASEQDKLLDANVSFPSKSKGRLIALHPRKGKGWNLNAVISEV